MYNATRQQKKIEYLFIQSFFIYSIRDETQNIRKEMKKND